MRHLAWAVAKAALVACTGFSLYFGLGCSKSSGSPRATVATSAKRPPVFGNSSGPAANGGSGIRTRQPKPETGDSWERGRTGTAGENERKDVPESGNGAGRTRGGAPGSDIDEGRRRGIKTQ